MNDFAVAPVLGTEGAAGHHHYVVEVDETSHAELASGIDASLTEQSADYRTKRANNIVIAPPQVHLVPSGTFASWMTANGQAGGQRKVPRVTTTTKLDEIVRSSAAQTSNG